MDSKSKNILIRLCYIIPFIIFAITFIEEGFFTEDRFRQFSYEIIIPMLVFLYQSIRNSIVGWVMVMILYVLFLFIIAKGLVHSYQNLGAKTDETIFIFQIVVGLIFLGLGVLYWKIRPKNRLI